MAKVFITGISGFVGGELARQMAAAGHSVTGSSFTTAKKNQIKCDIRKAEEILAAVIGSQPDIIIHAAALSSVTLGRTMDYYESNVLGTENVITAVNALGGRKRFVFISTAAVYGNQNVEILTEDLPPLPVSHYGMSKLVCERMLANMSDNHDITIIRPFNIIGPGQNKSFIVPKLVKHFAELKPSIRLGNLDPVRDYIDIWTSCSIISQLAMMPEAIGVTVNLCSGIGKSVREMLDVLGELTNHTIEVIDAPEFKRKSEVWRLLGGTDKLHQLLPQYKREPALKAVLAEMLIEASVTN